jgi:hypothetical protein
MIQGHGRSSTRKMANLELVKVVRLLGTDLQYDGVEGLNCNMMKIKGSMQNSVDKPLISEDTVDGPMGDFYEFEDTTSRLQPWIFWMTPSFTEIKGFVKLLTLTKALTGRQPRY